MAITDHRMIFLDKQKDAAGNPFQWLGQPVNAVGGAIIQRLQYGDFVFNPAATETLRCTAKPVQDAARRTIKYVEHYLLVRTVIVVEEPNTTDAAVQSALNTLTSQGLNLVYQQKGFGRFNINVGGGVGAGGAVDAAQGVLASPQRDADWGPVPQVVDCKPLADNHAWELVWGVTVCIPRCDNATYQGAVMDFGYEVQYARDGGGYGTRTVKGHLEIPLTRQPGGDRRLRETADDYLDGIKIDVPAGFREGAFDHTLSMNRSRIDFTTTQEQLPGAVPPLGVLHCRLGMKLNNTDSGNLVKWVFTIDGEYEMAYGNFQPLAYGHFVRVVADRIVRLNAVCTPEPAKPNMGAGVAPIAKVAAGLGAALGAASVLAPLPLKIPLLGAAIIATGTGVALGLPNPGAAAGAGAGSFAGGGTISGTPLTPLDDARRRAAAALYPGTPRNPAKPGPSPLPPDQIGQNGPGLAPTVAAAAMAGTGAAGAGGTALATSDPDFGNLLAGKGVCVRPIFWSAEDPDAYGKPKARFSCTLLVTGTKFQLLAAGLWEPVVDTPTYARWKTSLGNIWNKRGIAGLKFKASDDVIIDLCKEADPTSTLKGKDIGFSTLKSFGVPDPGINNLWVDWQNTTTVSQMQSVAVFKPLPTDSLLATPAALNTPVPTVPPDFAAEAGNAFRSGVGTFAGEYPSQIETGAAPTYYVEMSGSAAKFAGHPEPPQLVAIGGVPAVLCGEPEVMYEVVGNMGDPLYKTSWVLKYVLPQPAYTNVGEAAGFSGLTSATPTGGNSSLRAGGMARPF